MAKKQSSKPSTISGENRDEVHSEGAAAQTRAAATLVENRQWFFVFAGVSSLLGWILPAFEHKLEAYSLASIMVNYAGLPAPIAAAVPNRGSLVFPLVVAVLCLVPVLASKANLKIALQFPRTLLSLLAIAAIFPTVQTMLYVNSDNVKYVSVLAGYHLYVAAGIGIFILCLATLKSLDDADQMKTEVREVGLAVAFVALMFVVALINYQYVNFRLIPKATEILPSLPKN